jgi:hypothetical protein
VRAAAVCVHYERRRAEYEREPGRCGGGGRVLPGAGGGGEAAGDVQGVADGGGRGVGAGAAVRERGFAGWYLLPTQPPTAVARGWADLTEPNEDVPGNYLQSAIVTDEKGNTLGDANVWTNTQVNGTQQDPAAHCSSWSTDNGDLNGLTGRGKPGVLDASWTNNKQIDCANGGRLYCFQTE